MGSLFERRALQAPVIGRGICLWHSLLGDLQLKVKCELCQGLTALAYRVSEEIAHGKDDDVMGRRTRISLKAK